MKEQKPTRLLQKIFELRKAKKISLDELGEVMGGVNNSTASHIENGDVPLKAEYIPAIAKLLGVEPWEFFVDEKKKTTFPLTKEEEKVILLYRKIKTEKE